MLRGGGFRSLRASRPITSRCRRQSLREHGLLLPLGEPTPLLSETSTASNPTEVRHPAPLPGLRDRPTNAALDCMYADVWCFCNTEPRIKAIRRVTRKESSPNLGRCAAWIWRSLGGPGTDCLGTAGLAHREFWSCGNWVEGEACGFFLWSDHAQRESPADFLIGCTERLADAGLLSASKKDGANVRHAAATAPAVLRPAHGRSTPSTLARSVLGCSSSCSERDSSALAHFVTRQTNPRRILLAAAAANRTRSDRLV